MGSWLTRLERGAEDADNLVRLRNFPPFYPIRGRDSLDLVEMHILKLGSYAPQAESSFQTAIIWRE